ncbi:MAG: HTTM domain-containing protein [Leptolyngbyaceae cyanobacterium MO_188.B28]|nr:HTTM domain-containing protein [Leptolyngbyaceae cyanobacterium MO_188.B28]
MFLKSFSNALSLWLSRFSAPVDIGSLIYFRIAFGAIMLWEMGRYFNHDWIRRYYIEPTFHFTYYGFGWVRPWPAVGMYLHFCGLTILAICILLGLWYRLSMALFCGGFTYIFLLDQTRYLNHFYLISLISLLMIFAPAHRALSIDVLRQPKLRADTASTWTLWSLRTQIGMVYFYAGVAKFNSDWLQGEPMRMWLAERTDLPLMGLLSTETWMGCLLSYGGLLFDLLVIPCLLCRRTRLFAFAIAVGFHWMNSSLFSIGVFPWFMIAATTLFFQPNWPLPRALQGWTTNRAPPKVFRTPLHFRHWIVIALLSAYLVLQLLIPLRHFLYPGSVSWTEEGHRFAWRMKLRDKEADAKFIAIDPLTQATQIIDPLDQLTPMHFRFADFSPVM